MITVAARLLRDVEGEGGQADKPTVLMFVDRNELEQQLFRNIAAYGIGTVEVAQNKQELEELLTDDYRGLLVSMIHKFDGIPADVNTRDNIVVLVDEAHRTTGGDLGNYLDGGLPNATYIGFTGTPIDRLSKGKGTFKVFGGGRPEGYLDKYSMRESIADGTTVPLNYALAPSKLRVDRGDAGAAIPGSLAEAEGVSRGRGDRRHPEPGRRAQGDDEAREPGRQDRRLRSPALPGECRADGFQGVPGRRGP